MPEPTLAELLIIATEAVDRAGEMLRTHAPGVITMKSDRNPATEVDYAIEREIRDFLLATAPSVGFIGEEDGRAGQKSDLTWALDPIDGTVNFMHGIPLCGVSLGLIRRTHPILGIVDLPFVSERYTATLGGGAFRGDNPVHVDNVANLADAVVALGDYAVGRNASKKNLERIQIAENLAGRVQRIRMLGSAATDLAWVADGRISASVMLNNKPWDTAAGVLLAREAGAVVVDRAGHEHSLNSTSTVAVNPTLCETLIDLLDV